jgi:hypothetical protein
MLIARPACVLSRYGAAAKVRRYEEGPIRHLRLSRFPGVRLAAR